MKKVLTLLFLVLGFAFMSQVSAEAKVTTYEDAVKVVDKANEKIEAEIEKAIAKEAKLSDNSKYDEKLDKIIIKLQNKTTRIADKTIEKLEKDGFIVICEYQKVTIGNRVIEIDPLRIHYW
ncbi:hypothetical protein KHQ81_07930 [Mycoplasmatota bacterium]|nr:hypothetical protein KHQ81_07930 [Mycoplasmatota bacterium]